MTTPIRVVTVGMPPLQEDLVRGTLAAEPELYVVARVGSEQSISEVLGQHPADVIVVWATAGELLKSAIDLLSAQPLLGLVLLTGRGDRFVEAQAAISVDKSWPAGLVEAVRHAARHEAI
jgi:hypothetical protein